MEPDHTNHQKNHFSYIVLDVSLHTLSISFLQTSPCTAYCLSNNVVLKIKPALPVSTVVSGSGTFTQQICSVMSKQQAFLFPLLWKATECALDFYFSESSRTLPQRQNREPGGQGVIIIIVLKMAALLSHFPVVLQITVSSWWLLVSPISLWSIVLSGRPCLVASVILIFKPQREDWPLAVTTDWWKGNNS